MSSRFKNESVCWMWSYLPPMDLVQQVTLTLNFTFLIHATTRQKWGGLQTKILKKGMSVDRATTNLYPDTGDF